VRVRGLLIVFELVISMDEWMDGWMNGEYCKPRIITLELPYKCLAQPMFPILSEKVFKCLFYLKITKQAISWTSQMDIIEILVIVISPYLWELEACC
jgi:hypothetical protein